jgi:hypothetical protein
MGLFDWLLRRFAPAPRAVGTIDGPDTYSVDVVGESHYQDALERICGGRSEEGADEVVRATLVFEDNNPHDNQAVRVDINGMTVGYLSRQNAREYRKQLKKAGHPGVVATCPAKIVGGWDRGQRDRGHFGVRLDLPTSDE